MQEYLLPKIQFITAVFPIFRDAEIFSCPYSAPIYFFRELRDVSLTRISVHLFAIALLRLIPCAPFDKEREEEALSVCLKPPTNVRFPRGITKNKRSGKRRNPGHGMNGTFIERFFAVCNPNGTARLEKNGCSKVG